VGGTLSKAQVRRIAAAAGLGAGASLAMGGVAHAANYVVGSTDDTALDGDCLNAANTDCTLRDAINDSNASTGVSDVISFRSGVTGTITLGSDLPAITDPVSIHGPGADSITVDGASLHRIFDVRPSTPGDAVLISGLELTHANADTSAINGDRGGAVLNETADLTLADTIITGNTSPSYGAGIYSGCDDACGATAGNAYVADLTLARVTLSDNHSTGAAGGGVYLNYGSATIFSSTINGNSGNWGPAIGIFYMQGPVTIENTTITGNTTAGDGGGVYVDYNPSGVILENSTIAGNTADTGGGIYANDATAGPPRSQTVLNPVLRNTIVAANTGTTASPDVFSGNGSAFDSAFSLIGNTSGASINPTVAGSNITGTNPVLGPLANNGGGTLTMAPLAGSPAIDKGSGFGVGVDQRGLTRPIDLPDYKNSTAAGADGSDIGAVELQTSPGGGDVTPATPAPAPAKTKKCKKKKHKRSASAAKKKCKKKKKK
jgi:hypothetical protein